MTSETEEATSKSARYTTTKLRIRVFKFERQLDQPNSNQIVMKVRAETNRDTEDYIARYKRVLG